VTARGVRQSATKQYEPDVGLVRSFALKFRFDAKRVADALSAFGPLPENGQKQLLECLLELWGGFQRFDKELFVSILPGAKQKKLSQIANTAGQLLTLLGMPEIGTSNYYVFDVDKKDATLKPLWDMPVDGSASALLWRFGKQSTSGNLIAASLMCASLDSADHEGVHRAVSEANERVAQVIFGLLWLHNRAKSALQSSSRGAKKHGGVRRGQTQTGFMILNAIGIYAHMRENYPNSGNPPAFGGPMCSFVRATANLFGDKVSDDQIKEGLRRWKTNQRNS